MSCLLSAFSIVWIYTVSQVSSDVLLCSLAERMSGLTPPLLFIWLFEGSRCHCSLQPLHLDFSAWFLNCSVSNTPPWFALWSCDRNLHLVAVFQDVPGIIWFVVTPITFHSAPAYCFSFCYQNFGPVLVLQVSTADCKRRLSLAHTLPTQ